MEIDSIPLGLTFDDVLLMPQESSIRPHEAVLRTRLTKRVHLETPLLSAAMDTVTEAPMAIALAELGGIGVLHRNCTVNEQVRMVSKVKKKKYLVAAAVGPKDTERAEALDKAGADVLVFDSAHIHKPGNIAVLKELKRKLKADIIVGNLATAKAAQMFVGLADGLKVGVGPGAICTTRIVSGVGVPQLTAISDVVKEAKKKKVPVIADGGIKYSGDIVKALAAGAESVMLGSLLSGTTETPGSIVTSKGKKMKRYRGMGSLGAMQKGQSSDRYGQKGQPKYVPEGVEALTPYKGKVKDVVFHLLGGLRAGMGYLGATTISELQKRAQFIRITQASLTESHPHSIAIEKKAPNY